MPQPNAGPAQPPVKQAVNDGVDQQAESEASSGAEESSQNATDESAASDNIQFASKLNLPADIQSAISKVKPKAKPEEKKKAEPEGPADAQGEEETETESEPDKQDESEETSQAGEEEESASAAKGEAEPEEESEEEKGEEQFRGRNKLVRRNKKLTRRVHDLERLLADQGSKSSEAQQPEERQVTPQGASSLQGVRTEPQLDGLLAQAEAAVDWCEENAEGVEGEKGFIEPKDIAAAKRSAEKVLRGAETRRRQIREYNNQKRDFDETTRKHFPQLFEKDSEHYKIATSILALRPWLRNDPAVHLMLGVWSDWLIKATEGQQKPAASKNGKNGKHPVSKEEDDDDLDERLTPEFQRTHIPPTPTPATKPPNRGITPSHLRKETVENITKQFTQPGGATVATLATALEALDEDDVRGRRKVAV